MKENSDKRRSKRISVENYYPRKRQKSLHRKRTLSLIKENNLSKNENESSKKLSYISTTQIITINQKQVKLVDPDAYVYDSPHLYTKPRDFASLCNDLKTLEIQNRNIHQIKNNIFDIEDDFDFSNMNNNLKLTTANYDYNNVVEILKIVEKIKIPPEDRKMDDLLEIVKYLTTTKLGKYFKEGFEQKEIFEKLITFCGVEMKYKFFKKGETIFRIGELPDNFYIILYGKVDILKPISVNVKFTGYQYFSYLMELKKSKDEHLFDLCINANRIHFRIDYDDIIDLKYIYLYIVLEQINRHKYVDFGEALKLVDMSYKDFHLDPDELSNTKYIAENMKKIKIYLPDLPITTISKYIFFRDTNIQKEVVIYRYSSFLTLETKSHFGDSAMDSNTTRNATIAAKEDTHTAYISCSSYFRNVVVEKAAIMDKKVHFLNSNFIFSKIVQKKFEQKYFGLFICNNYKKGDIIYHEDDLPLNTYFIEQGDIELYTSKNIYELQNVIEYLEDKRFKFLGNKNTHEEKSGDKKYFFTYSKINVRENDISKEINEKKTNKIFLLRENEDLGILSFYFGYPYIATSIVCSATAKIYKIDNKYLSDLILKEKICYYDLIKRVKRKLSIFHERFFTINNTKLLMADHQKNMDNKGEKNNNQRYLKHSNNNFINDISEENVQNNLKNTFNKTSFKFNFSKLKNLFDKFHNANSVVKNGIKNIQEQKLNLNNNNIMQKPNLPSIYTQKSIKISDNNISTDKTYSIKLKSVESKNDEINTNSKSKKKEKNNILKKKGIFSNSSVTKAMSIKKNKNNFNKSNFFLFKNKSSSYIEEKKFCIDPVLKMSCENYEKINNNKKFEFNVPLKNKSIEETKIKTKLHKHLSGEKNKALNQLTNITLFKNNNINNYSISCKSKSYSRNIMNFSTKKSNDENNQKNNKGIITNKDTIYDYKKKDAPKRLKQKLINHPYFSPLVLRKKEIYEIFKGNPLNKKFEPIKFIQKSNIEEIELNKVGNFFKFDL